MEENVIVPENDPWSQLSSKNLRVDVFKDAWPSILSQYNFFLNALCYEENKGQN